MASRAALLLALGHAVSPTGYTVSDGFCATAQDTTVDYGQTSIGKMTREKCEIICDQSPVCRAFQFGSATDKEGDCMNGNSHLVVKGEGSLGSRCFVKPDRTAFTKFNGKCQKAVVTPAPADAAAGAAAAPTTTYVDVEFDDERAALKSTKKTADDCKAACETSALCKGYAFKPDQAAANPAIAVGQCFMETPDVPVKGDDKTAGVECYVKTANNADAVPTLFSTSSGTTIFKAVDSENRKCKDDTTIALHQAVLELTAADTDAVTKCGDQCAAYTDPTGAGRACLGFELKTASSAVPNADTVTMMCVLFNGPCVMEAADAASKIVGQYTLDQTRGANRLLLILGGAVLLLALVAAAAMLCGGKKKAAAGKRGVGKKGEGDEEYHNYGSSYNPGMFNPLMQQPMYAQPAMQMQAMPVQYR